MPIDPTLFILPVAVLATVVNTGEVSNYWLALQARLVSFFEWFGELGIFCGRLARAVFVPPYEIREIIRQMDVIGAKSLPLVALAWLWFDNWRLGLRATLVGAAASALGTSWRYIRATGA